MTCAEHLREWLGSAGVSPSHDQKEGTEDKEHVRKKPFEDDFEIPKRQYVPNVQQICLNMLFSPCSRAQC